MSNWLLAIIFAMVAVSMVAASKSEKQLIAHIIEQAGGPQGRPVKDGKDCMTVKVKLFLNQIINEPDNSLTTVNFLMTEWNDEYIGWNPQHYCGKTMVPMSVASIWHPDIFSITDSYNNIEDQYRWLKMQQAWVYYNGTVVWNGVLRTRNLCSPRKNFAQKKNCTFQIGSLSYNAKEIRLKFSGESDFEMGQYVETPGIKIVSHSAKRVLEPYDQPRPNTLYFGLNYNLIVKLSDDVSSSDQSSGSSQDYQKKYYRRKLIL